jgi:hypothetical protein
LTTSYRQRHEPKRDRPPAGTEGQETGATTTLSASSVPEGAGVVIMTVDANYGARLFAQHAAMLAESAISPDHARARGYVTVDAKVRLELLRVTKAGRNVPDLLVPQLRKDGSTWGYQYRQDVPRLNASGKPVKYETPFGQRNGIDVPPGVGSMLDDPRVALWIT